MSLYSAKMATYFKIEKMLLNLFVTLPKTNKDASKLMASKFTLVSDLELQDMNIGKWTAGLH